MKSENLRGYNGARARKLLSISVTISVYRKWLTSKPRPELSVFCTWHIPSGIKNFLEEEIKDLVKNGANGYNGERTLQRMVPSTVESGRLSLSVRRGNKVATAMTKEFVIKKDVRSSSAIIKQFRRISFIHFPSLRLVPVSPVTFCVGQLSCEDRTTLVGEKSFGNEWDRPECKISSRGYYSIEWDNFDFRQILRFEKAIFWIWKFPENSFSGKIKKYLNCSTKFQLLKKLVIGEDESRSWARRSRKRLFGANSWRRWIRRGKRWTGRSRMGGVWKFYEVCWGERRL